MNRSQNEKAIAAMSHDMRAPLTALICYLDLLYDGHYPDEEAMHMYLRNARLRAGELKNMSDRIYDLATTSSSSIAIHTEQQDGLHFFSQLLDRMRHTLRQNGFRVDFQADLDAAFTVQVDEAAVLRIFDNLTTNALRYANLSHPVTLRASLGNSSIHIKQKNFKSISPREESSNLGLSIVRSLILAHGGGFRLEELQKSFEISMSFPIDTV